MAARSLSCPVRAMAPTVFDDPRLVRPGLAASPLTCSYTVERVTGIEPHYQLGICAIRAAVIADLPFGVSASDLETSGHRG
jgi:hypothetical protein